MFHDARSIPAGSVIEADVAIVGGGPAGITVARRLRDSGYRIALFESGDHGFDAATQALYEGENDPSAIFYPPATLRLRYLGGSSNHWGGYCRPLDPIDFERRDWVPHSGWPIRREDLDPYYPEASAIVEVGPVAYDEPTYWLRRAGHEALPMPRRWMHTRCFQFSPPTRFGSRYRGELAQARDVDVYLNANVLEIVATANARAVSGLRLQTLGGPVFHARARCYVLAAGGIENARLLLLSDNVETAGLGNGHDQVGRYFMDHPHLTGFCEIVVGDRARLPLLYRDTRILDGTPVKAVLVPRPEVLRRERLLNASFTMGVAGLYQLEGEPPPAGSGAEHAAMLKAARFFLQGAAAPEDASLGVWMGVGCACEQAPNPESRVTLSETRDALGLRRVRLAWRPGEQDRHSVYRHIKALGEEFGAMGIGRMVVRIPDDRAWPPDTTGGAHHMGTTRMSGDPARGVVDRDCRVHSVANLWIAGSSVFTTSGSANPTLNIVALALRLADHLKERLDAAQQL